MFIDVDIIFNGDNFFFIILVLPFYQCSGICLKIPNLVAELVQEAAVYLSAANKTTADPSCRIRD